MGRVRTRGAPRGTPVPAGRKRRPSAVREPAVAMAAARRVSRQSTPRRAAKRRRYTVDASVFVNAFNPHEDGHTASLQLLAAIQERGDPIIVAALCLLEIAP